MKVLEKILGRMKMAINTMQAHSDEHVRKENALRARCYQNAYDDVENDEEVRAAYEIAVRVHALWQADLLQNMSGQAYVELRPLLVKFDENMRKP